MLGGSALVRRDGSPKVGRPVEFDTPAAKRRKVTQEKAHVRLQEKLTLGACVRNEKHCPHDHSQFSPELVLKLRIYFYRLSKVDQRQFLGPGHRCDNNRERISAGGDLSNARLLINYRLENPALLEKRLTAALIDDTKVLTAPAVSECVPVCQQ